MSLFQGIETGKKALIAHQYSLNTSSHNIANVNTPGYTRQRVLTTSAYPMEMPEGPLGMGVEIASSDPFLLQNTVQGLEEYFFLHLGHTDPYHLLL